MNPFPPVRTLTVFCTIDSATDPRLDAALATLDRARHAAREEGYEVQTRRLAARFPPQPLERALHDRLVDIDARLRSEDVLWTPGAQLAQGDRGRFPSWAAGVIRATSAAFLSVPIADADRVLDEAVSAAARTIAEVADGTADGDGNFRFAAAALCPAHTPFFPVAWHDGPPAISASLEAAGLVANMVRGSAPMTPVVDALTAAARPLEALLLGVARERGCEYAGLDVSPAPGLAASIGEAIERCSGVPLGRAGTLAACARVAGAVRATRVTRCGYSGLMLPVLEDRVLARRADEGAYTLRDLLLWSSVCGAGLDVVPLAGTTDLDALERLLRDVAALAIRWQKPLSARLLPVPGTHAGDRSRFEHPLLVNARVFAVD